MSVPANTTSSPFALTTQDVYGNVSPPDTSSVAYLYSDSGTGSFSVGGSSVNSLTIAAGAATTSFAYKDTSFQSTPSTITVSDKDQLDNPDVNIINATSQVTIVSQPVNTIAFTSQPQTIQAGHRSQKVTISLRQTDGSLAYQDGSTNLLLDGGNGGTFYEDTTSQTAINQITVPRGAASVDVYYESIYSGQRTLTALLGQKTGSQQMVVTPDTAVSMKVVSQPQHQYADVPSSQIIVNYYDKYLNAATLDTAQTINLESSCGTGRFSESATNWQNTNAINVPAGSDQLVFYYQSSVMGNCTLTISNDLLGSASQVFRVDHALAATISLNALKPVVTVGQQVNVGFTLKDIYGNVVPLTMSKTFYLISSSSTGTVTPQSLTLSAGQSTGNFAYTDSSPGSVKLQLRDQPGASEAIGSLTDVEATLNVVQGDASKLTIEPTSESVKAGDYQAVTVTARNAFGAETAVVDDVIVQLQTTGSGLFKSVAGDTEPNVTELTIPSGQSRATVYYAQTHIGATTLTSHDPTNVLADGTAPLNVYGADISTLSFASQPRRQVTGEYGQVTVQLLDRYGNVTKTDAPLRVYLNAASGTGKFYTAPSPSAVTDSAIIRAGTSLMTVYYRDSEPADGSISVRDEVVAGPDIGITNASQTMSVWYGDPVQVQLDTPDFSLVRGQVVGPIEVHLLNTAGTVIPAPNDTALNVHDTAGGLYATDINGTWSSSPAITISAGSTGAAFYYTNRTAPQYSSYRLYAEAQLSGSTRMDYAGFGLSYGSATQLNFVSPPQTYSAQHPSAQMTVELRNAYGAAVPNPAERRIYLRSNSATGEFSTVANAAWGTNYVLMPKDNERISFYYRDSSAGQPTMTVADNLPVAPDTGLLNAQQQVTVTPQVFDHFYVANISDPQNAGTPSSVVVIAQDAEGYTIESYAGAVTFSSSDPGAVLPEPYTYRPAIDKGSKTFTNGIAFRSIGEKTVTVTDQNGKSGAQTDITVGAANTNPVQAVAMIDPSTPYSLGRNQVSQAITVQLKDASSIATTSGAGGYAVRLTTTSPTGELAMNPSGPWQASNMITAVPAGLSSVNIYYRDSQLGSSQLLAADWVDGVDSALVANGSLDVVIDELTIDTTLNVWSESALGHERPSRYLYAHDSTGAIAGRASALFTSRNARDGSPYATDWQLSWQQGSTLLDQFTQRQTTSLSYDMGPLSANASAQNYQLDVVATDSQATSKQRTVIVPVSPWVVKAKVDSLANATDRLSVTADIQQLNNGPVATTARYTVYRDNDYSRAIATITGSVTGSGSLAQNFAPKAVPAGNYKLFVQLFDSDNNVLAEDISPSFTVGPEATAPVTPDPVEPTPPSIEPVLPVVSPDVPGGLAVHDLSQIATGGAPLRPTPATSGRTVEPSVEPGTLSVVLGAVQRTAVQVAASPYTPIVVPLLFLIGLAGFAATIVLQILRQIEYSAQLRRILRKEQQTAHDKTQFVNLIAHHLRTPVTVITGALELLAAKPEGRPLLAVLQPKAASLTQLANELVTSINSQVNIPQATAREMREVKIYQLPSFWIAGTIGAAVLVLVNVFVTTLGSQSLGIYTYLGQLFIVSAALSLLYFVLQERRNKKNLIARMTTAMYHRDELDGAKNHAIRMVANLLGDKLADLHASAEPVISSNMLGSKQLAAGLRQLQSVVEVMNTLSSIEVAKVESEVVDIQAVLVGGLIDRLESLESKHVKVTEDLTVPELSTDSELFTAVASSVLDNAVAFSPDGGEITVKSLDTADSTQIIIDDMGPGLPEAVTSQMLQPFTHPGDELTETHQGLGLSLYLDELIMRHLGGEIAFERSESGGAQVRLTLPKVTPEEIPS